MIDTAWAKDGNGKDIETYYEIKGQTIVQVVKHKVKGTVYPVTADPQIDRYWWGNVYRLSRNETNKLMLGSGIVAVIGIWVPDPLISKLIATFGGVSASFIGYYYNEGNCFAIALPRVGSGWFYFYKNNSYCR